MEWLGGLGLLALIVWAFWFAWTAPDEHGDTPCKDCEDTR